MSDAATVLERCAALGEVSEDAVGNLIGRLAGPEGARTLVLASHLDTVRDAGRYDGPLGVLVALAAVEPLRGWLPFAVEVIGFADEEGVRFGTAYLGSAPVAGRFDPRWLQLRDADGVALRDLLRGDPATAARDPAALLGYAEVHIEQGPVLERLGEPVGAVTAIAGQTHAEVRFDGEAGHAGTVPMDARRDALAAAAEWGLAVEEAGVLATVGRLAVEPGARNVIPARATLSLDVRDADDATRRTAVAALRDRAWEIARRRGVDLGWDETGDVPAVAMDERLTSAFGVPVRLPSGAGHDATVMASITPAAMLFVRCRGGVSHNPAEAVDEADVAVAIDVLERFLHAV